MLKILQMNPLFSIKIILVICFDFFFKRCKIKKEVSMKRTIRELVNLKGKVVLLRVDFNVPLDEGGKILDATRIKNELPTIRYLISKGAKVVILSHLGRPDGYDVRKSLWPISIYLSRVLPCSVSFSSTVLGEETRERIKMLKDGNVLLLENVRFYKQEEECDMKFAREIASMGDIFVNDAFGTAHRKHATTYGLGRLMPNAIGFLIEKELNNLNKILEEPKRPFVVVLGGAKVETKIKILERFVEKADTILIGGAMAYTFLKALGRDVGLSKVQDDYLEVAQNILEKAKELGKKILLPIDHVCLKGRDPHPVEVTTLKGDLVGYDIGSRTIRYFARELDKAGEIFWNGPLGMYENANFRIGTRSIAEIIAESKAHKSAGGGDTIAMINLFNLGKKFDYLSTGGGATLEYLEEGSLPAIEVIQEKIY